MKRKNERKQKKLATFETDGLQTFQSRANIIWLQQFKKPVGAAAPQLLLVLNCFIIRFILDVDILWGISKSTAKCDLIDVLRRSSEPLASRFFSTTCRPSLQILWGEGVFHDYQTISWDSFGIRLVFFWDGLLSHLQEKELLAVGCDCEIYQPTIDN